MSLIRLALRFGERQRNGPHLHIVIGYCNAIRLAKETEEVITAARAVHAGTPGRTKVARPGQFNSVLRGYRGEIRK